MEGLPPQEPAHDMCRLDGRRGVAPTEDGQGEAVETKYRCKGCGHEWKVRVAQPG